MGCVLIDRQGCLQTRIAFSVWPTRKYARARSRRAGRTEDLHDGLRQKWKGGRRIFQAQVGEAQPIVEFRPVGCWLQEIL